MIMNRAICLTSDTILEPLVIQQYDKDSRTVQLTVYETPGVLYDLTERSADVVYRVNGVNTPAYNARVVGENTVEFTIPGEVTENEGNSVVQVRFYQGEELLHSQLIPLIVRFSLTDGSGGEEDPTPLFVELLREARDAIAEADAATEEATNAANEANAAAEDLEEVKNAANAAAENAANQAAAAMQATTYARDAGQAAGEAKTEASRAAQAAILAAEQAATQTNLARGATEEAINATTATRGATDEAGRQATNAMNAAKTANDAANTANTAANNADVQAVSAANATMRALTAAGKPPIVNPATGTWRIWDDGAQAYEETTYRAQGPEGTRGFTPTITATRQEYGVLLHIQNENSTETQMLYDGEDGKIDMNLQDGIAEGSVKIVGSKDETEGYPIGKYATSFAFDGTAGGDYSHTEGRSTRAAGLAAHAEGNGSSASGDYSHAENESQATGRNSHSENKASAEAENSHAEGLGTVTRSMNQHAQGRYNVADDQDAYAHIVGNGTSNSDRRNAHTLDWEGNAWYAGNVYAGADRSESNRLVRKSELATSGGGMVGSGKPYQQMVTDINGNAMWEDREFYTAGGRRALMDNADLGTIGTLYTQVDASKLLELPEPGKEYVVVWQGKEYSVEPYAFTSGATWIPMTGATEDVPFHFTISHNNGMITRVMVKAYESTDNVVCGIYEEVPETIKPIDPKYLQSGGKPHQMLVTDANGKTMWVERTHYPGTGRSIILPEMRLGDLPQGSTIYTKAIEPFVKGDIKAGETYFVTYNGKEYECVAFYEDGVVMVAENGSALESPFIVWWPDPGNGDREFVLDRDDLPDDTIIKIEGEGTAYKKIDPAYLPEGGVGWTEEGGETVLLDVVLDESTLNPDIGAYFVTEPLAESLEVGEEYTVEWNGVEYTSTAFMLDGVGLGNAALMMGTGDTGEPFVFAETPPEMVAEIGGYAMVVPLDGSTTITLKLSKSGEIIHGFDPKYFPKGYPYVERKKVTIYEASITQEEAEAMGGEVIITSPLGAAVEVGGQYYVTVAGVSYECTAQAFDPGMGVVLPVLGNLAGMTGEETDSTDEPFCMAFAPSGMEEALGMYAVLQLMFPDDADVPFPLTIRVNGEGEVIHPMDEKFLPKTFGGSGSGMKITITKGESGNYTTDTRLVDVYDMPAAELQAAITAIDGIWEMGVFGLSKSMYGGSVPWITFYVAPSDDTLGAPVKRISWLGNAQFDQIGYDGNFDGWQPIVQ